MARASANKCLLHTLNALYIIITLALAAASLWFFVQLYEITSLRNMNHYLLDYTVYWPQVVPWMFFVISLLGAAVACVGFVSTTKQNKRLLVTYSILQGILIVIFLAAGIIALIFADTKGADDFIKETVWDVFSQMKDHNEIEASFGNIEKRLQCCGADSPRDYKSWKNEFPMSCCEMYYRYSFYDNYVVECDFSNKRANERYGCGTVAIEYTRIVTKVFGSVSIFLAFICIIALIVAVALSKALKQKPRVLAHPSEFESKKVLL